ncbi:MAG: DUF2877 domain-containing protein [Anaerolineaceae bacterium]|nr:DUF2877 domain-containing protein [Anaerolineaceae bacterium]
MTEITYTLTKTTIGKFAYEWLLQSNQVVVWGNTSSGLFLHVQGNRIIFLTKKDHFGPVNVIIQNQIPVQWKNEDEVQIIHADREFILTNNKQQIKLNIENIWKTPQKPAGFISDIEQKNRIKQAANQLSLLKNEQGYAPLLLPFVSDTLSLETDNTWLFSSWNTIKLLKISMIQKDTESILSLANLLIGSGRGLTPSGDDLLTGLTFMRRRWFPEVNWMADVEDQLLTIFKVKTTSVSNTLFECAMQGEADARIQEMADVLMSTEIPFQQQAMELSRWGNSSGADVFLGMLLAIESFQNHM